MGVIGPRQPNKDDYTQAFVSKKVPGLHILSLIQILYTLNTVVGDESEAVESRLSRSGGIGRRAGFKIR